MSYGWIESGDFSFNTLLLMNRWILNTIAENQNPELATITKRNGGKGAA